MLVDADEFEEDDDVERDKYLDVTSRALGRRGGGALSESDGSSGGRFGICDGRCFGVDATAVTISHPRNQPIKTLIPQQKPPLRCDSALEWERRGAEISEAIILRERKRSGVNEWLEREKEKDHMTVASTANIYIHIILKLYLYLYT